MIEMIMCSPVAFIPEVLCLCPPLPSICWQYSLPIARCVEPNYFRQIFHPNKSLWEVLVLSHSIKCVFVCVPFGETSYYFLSSQDVGGKYPQCNTHAAIKSDSGCKPFLPLSKQNKKVWLELDFKPPIALWELNFSFLIQPTPCLVNSQPS